MKKEQVVNCQFSVWYPLFKKHTIKSLVLPIPQNVIDYLLDDGTLVVSGSENNNLQSQTNNSDSDEEDIQWTDDETTTAVTAPEFPEFNIKVQEAINVLGGCVFPKLNWSAPRDANWIALNSSLQCQSLSDIFLLFKSSDFITHDLTQPFLHCSDDSPDPTINYELVLRKWSELLPGAEFRCFVKENKVIAISQRDYTQHYHHIAKHEDSISSSILDFFRDHIQYQFPDEDFVLDVYRDCSEGPAFRYTTSEVTVQPSPCLSYRIPRDFLDLTTGEDAYKLIDFLKLKKGQQDEEESSDEEGEGS
ncbi:Cell division cycle protein 123-like [Labeo rohita]|uniref:Translation initiation factor eIF2 assembly protein n=1 Tax=Labeo rohita TaxID=84645 RepID=A0A498ND06_LABRO|nr:Cell division cycle protein 123-like [Labeo rohita]RXN27475.1 Cell division cycle protein 123-like [Labeo rohita]